MDENLIQNEEQLYAYESARDKGKKYLKKYRDAINAVDKRSDELQELLAFFEGDQYSLANYADSTPWVVRMNTPHAKVKIEERVASLTASEYAGELFPLRLEDLETIKMLNEFYQDEWERLELDWLIDSSIKDASYQREAYLHLTFNEDAKYGGSRDGVIEAALIDAPSIIIDPNARTWKQAMYIAVAGRISVSEAQERWPIARSIKPKQGGLTADERGENSVTVDVETNQDDYYAQITMYEKSFKGKKVIITKHIIIEDVHVEKIVLDGLSRFPICQFRWGKRKQSPYGLSLLDDLLASQKAINAIESSTTNQAISEATPAVLVKRGIGLNPKDVSETIGMPQVVYAVNGPLNEAMAVFNPNPISSVSLDIKREHEATLARIAGVSDQFLGSLGTVGNTSGGAEMAISRAKVIEGELLRNITEYVHDITDLLVEYIVTQYSGMEAKTVKQDSTTKEFEEHAYKFPDNMKDIEFKFYVNLNVRTPYAKEQEKAAMMELWQMERQYDAEVKIINVLDILDKYNITNREELVERYKRMTASSLQGKAEVITQITGLANQYQLPPELLQAAIIEIMSDAKETPATDQLTQMIDQAVAAEEQAAQQAQMEAEQSQQAEQQANQEAAGMAANQIVDQMDPNMVMQMAQEQSAPNQIAQMMEQGG